MRRGGSRLPAPISLLGSIFNGMYRKKKLTVKNEIAVC
jgi:hypothetical protein